MTETYDIEELRAFVVMADEGYFCETAGALGISQPAVSQRISRLETSLGFHLFIRTAHGAILTPCGEKVLQTARRCVASHGQLLRQMDIHRYSSGGRVRVWFEPSLAHESLIQHLSESVPGTAELEILTDRRKSDWADQLRDLELDMVVCGSFLQQTVISGLERTELLHEPGLTAVWSKEHVQISPEAFSLNRALSLGLVLPSACWVKGLRSFLDDWSLRVYQQCAADVLEVHTCQEAVRACQAGPKIAILPGSMASSAHVLRDSSLASKGLFPEVLPNAYQVGLFLRNSEASSVVIEASLRLKKIFADCLLQR